MIERGPAPPPPPPKLHPPPAGATVAAVPDELRLRFADPDARSPPCGWSRPPASRRRAWSSRAPTAAGSSTVPDPGVQRLEYELELVDGDGNTETTCDPDNPLRAPGAFGEKSVVELPGYAAPAWLEAPRVDGHEEPLAIRSRALRHIVHGRLWSPADTDPATPLPLLVANDGPEYADLAGLTAYAATTIAAGRLPPHRIALLAPAHRDEWYSASTAYSRALVTEVLPALREQVAVAGPPAGAGASLGGAGHAARPAPPPR